MASESMGQTMRTSFPCTGADLAAARACERVVFGRHFGNTQVQLTAEYGPYEPYTSFGAVLLPDGQAVGVVRLLHGGLPALKSIHDASGDPWGLTSAAIVAAGVRPADTWDVASFGIDSKAARGWSRRVTMALFSVVFGAFRDNQVDSFVAVLDRAARRPIAVLGVEAHDFPGVFPASYLGSPASVPVYQHVQELHDTHSVRFASVHQQVFHGRDIEGLDPQLAAPGAFAVHAIDCVAREGQPTR